MMTKMRDYYEQRARWPNFNWTGEKERASVCMLREVGKSGLVHIKL